MSLSNPEYVKVDNKLYKINTDFRVALECNKIIADKNIGDYESTLAVLYKLFGKAGLDCDNQQKLVELAVQYLSLGASKNELKMDCNDKYQLDFEKCQGLIKSSFKFDYNYDPYTLDHLHWYTFYNDLQNLSTSEFGNCCILNRVASIINEDASKIKDNKEKSKFIETQQELRKMYCINNETQVEMTEEQKQSAINFYRDLGYEINE